VPANALGDLHLATRVADGHLSPLNSSISSSSLITEISLRLVATLACARVIRFSPIHALTMCTRLSGSIALAPLTVLLPRLTVLPPPPSDGSGYPRRKAAAELLGLEPAEEASQRALAGRPHGDIYVLGEELLAVLSEVRDIFSSCEPTQGAYDGDEDDVAQQMDDPDRHAVVLHVFDLTFYT